MERTLGDDPIRHRGNKAGRGGRLTRPGRRRDYNAAMAGPVIRTDIVDVYVFRRRSDRRSGDVEFLQLHRTAGQALAGTWQPVMGHMEQGETAAGTALRELEEETGFKPHAGLLGFWQLESPNTYFLHSHESIVMSPCFAAEVTPGAEPRLDASHDQVRWLAPDHADRYLLWPGQREAVRQVLRDILEPGALAEPVLRIDPGSL